MTDSYFNKNVEYLLYVNGESQDHLINSDALIVPWNCDWRTTKVL